MTVSVWVVIVVCIPTFIVGLWGGSWAMCRYLARREKK